MRLAPAINRAQADTRRWAQDTKMFAGQPTRGWKGEQVTGQELPKPREGGAPGFSAEEGHPRATRGRKSHDPEGEQRRGAGGCRPAPPCTQDSLDPCLHRSPNCPPHPCPQHTH